MASSELDVCVSAAREAGGIALDHRATGVRAEWKAARDVVTAADRAAESRIAEIIAAAWPDDLIVGEEGAPAPEAVVAGRRRWYVDPIDGTTNYVKGRSWFGVSVAFCDVDDRITAGAVNMPALGDLYAAASGHGATRNGEPIRCSDVTDISEALCCSGFPGAASMSETSERNIEVWRQVLRVALSVRATGAIAPDWCTVADGQSEASWTLRAGRWDIAAGILIAREAGAVVTDLAGAALEGPANAGIAAAPGIHPTLLSIVRDAIVGDSSIVRSPDGR